MYSVLDNQKVSKHTFEATTVKVDKNSRFFKDLDRKLRTTSRKNGIQGLFKDFP